MEIVVYVLGVWGIYCDCVYFGWYIIEGGQILIGFIIVWFGCLMNGMMDFDELNWKVVDFEFGLGGLIVQDYFQGNCMFYMDVLLCGVIIGLILVYELYYIFCVIMEGIGFGMCCIFDFMVDVGYCGIEIMIGGGVGVFDFWLQIYVDMVGLFVCLLQLCDVFFVGVVVFVVYGVGYFVLIDDGIVVMVKLGWCIEFCLCEMVFYNDFYE